MIQTIKSILSATRKAAVFEGEREVWNRIASNYEASEAARHALEKFCTGGFRAYVESEKKNNHA